MPSDHLRGAGPNQGPIRLLASARDPAAALHMVAVCRAIERDSRFTLHLVAQAPAAGMLRAAGLPVRELPSLRAQQPGDVAAVELLKLADGILDELKPDILLCGLSAPSEGGIDEALLARRQVPALLIQDFWGEQNHFFGAAPDLTVVLDAYAAQLTWHRHGTPTLVAGSPRHSEYSGFDIGAARTRVRAMFAADTAAAKRVFIGLFGQPLHRFPGYQRTLDAWAQAVHGLPGTVHVIYRPHPRDTARDLSMTQRWLADRRIDFVTLQDETTEDAIAACDAACTIFSNCAYDAAYMNYFSPTPLLTPVLMLFDPELRSVLAETGDYMRLPYIAGGLTLPVWREEDLAGALGRAAGEPCQAAVWAAARRELVNPLHAIEQIAERIVLMAASR